MFLYYINQVNEAFCGCVKYCQHKRKAFCSMGRGAICLPILPWLLRLSNIYRKNFLVKYKWWCFGQPPKLVRKWRHCPWDKHWDDLDKQKCIFCHLKNSQNILKETQVFLGLTYLSKYFEDLNFFENSKCNTRPVPLCCNSIERVAG